MVVKRKISKRRYFIAAILTLLIFVPGLLLGMVLDSERIRSLQQESQVQEINFKSSQLSFVYMSYLQDTNTSCVALKITLEKSIKDLSKSLETIERYKEDSKFNSADFEILSRKYLLDNLNYWLLSKKTKELCNYDTINLLYFFKSDCSVCPEQGVVLTYFKRKFGDNLLVFPIKTDLISSEPMVSILLNTYNITQYPTIVVDDVVYPGMMQTDALKNIFCEKYGFNETECNSV